MADVAFSAFFVIPPDMVAGHEAFHKAENPVIFFFLDKAAIDGHHLVASLPVVAKDRSAGDLGHGKGHLVPVVPGMGCTEDRKHPVFREAADAGHHVLYPPLFHCQLSFIGEMGNLAASAGVVCRTLGHRPFRGSLFDGNELSLGIGFLHHHHGGLHDFPRQGSRDKDCKIFYRTDAFPMDSQIPDGDGIDFVQFDRYISFRHGGAPLVIFPIIAVKAASSEEYKAMQKAVAPAVHAGPWAPALYFFFQYKNSRFVPMPLQGGAGAIFFHHEARGTAGRDVCAHREEQVAFATHDF